MAGVSNTYDPRAVAANFKSIPLGDYVDGTMIKVEYNEAGWAQKVGGQGEVARAKILNLTGKITVTILATSPVNDLLSAAYALDRAANLGFGSFYIEELTGTTLVTVPVAYIEKLPVIEYAGKEVGQREWVFLCEQIYENVGGVVPLVG
jgi:hypothetical protein